MTQELLASPLRARFFVICAALCAASALSACGDDDAPPPVDLGPSDAGSDLGPRDAGPAEDASLAEDSGADVDAGATVDAGPSVDAGPAALDVSIADFVAYSNCMPIVSSDPVIVFWDSVFTNSGSATATATITAATLTTTPASGAVTVSAIVVDVMSVDVPAGGTTVSMRKTSAVPPPPGACSTLCSGKAKLSLTFDLAGRAMTVESPEVDMGCVY